MRGRKLLEGLVEPISELELFGDALRGGVFEVLDRSSASAESNNTRS
jgi:hypothetical protein